MPGNEPDRAVLFSRIPVSDIHLDTERFRRYPGGRLEVSNYTEAFANSIVVWRDPADDTVYLVDGYRRYDLALEHHVGEIAVQWLDVSSAAEAREFRREKNASLYSREPDSNTLVFESPHGAFGVSNEHGWAVKPMGSSWIYGDDAYHHSGERRFVAKHWRLLDDEDPDRARLALESILDRPYSEPAFGHSSKRSLSLPAPIPSTSAEVVDLGDDAFAQWDSDDSSFRLWLGQGDCSLPVDEEGIAALMRYVSSFLADPLANRPPGRQRLNASLGASFQGDGLKLDWEPDGDWCPVYLDEQGVKSLSDFLASKCPPPSGAPVDDGPRLLDGPMRISGGNVLRVVKRTGVASPELWEDGFGWKSVDGSYLAEALTGREMSPAALEELGID